MYLSMLTRAYEFRIRDWISDVCSSCLHRGGHTCLSRKNTLEIPVTQSQLAVSLGISLVHTNKTLQSLRKRRILDWQPNQITFLDMEKAEALAGPDFSRELPRPYI